jgi:hypothetical protein
MDIIIELLKYYAKFVSKEVLRKNFIQPSATKKPSYDELRNEILAQSDLDVISELNQFIFSVNRKYVSDRVKNSKGFILFVEYGEIDFTPDVEHGVAGKIGITVAHELTISDNDLVNENLLMNAAYNILLQILFTMQSDMSNPDYCPIKTLIDFPAKITPVEPQLFYDCGGWSAIFEYSNTILSR